MVDLVTQTFDEVVEAEAVAIQGSATGTLVDFSVGSILRAFAQATAAIVMWLQGLILQLLTTTRASTSVGSDLDTWMADFGLDRLGAVAASGSVTFARFTPTLLAIIPVGSIVQTADGTQQFAVIADTTQAAFNASQSAYLIPAATTGVTATVQALTAGVSGNVAAGTINTLGQSISGVDTVVNAASFVDGSDAETDPALRIRFVNYLASLAEATTGAIGYAITSLQIGLTYTLTEDYDYAGDYTPGYFYVVVDDGSGSPPSGLLDTVTAAINATRACGIQFGVFAPATVTATIAMTVIAASGYTHSAVAAFLQAALADYIGAPAVGQNLTWGGVYNAIFNTPGVQSLSGLTINGATSDLTATAKNKIVAGTITIS